ncbi:MAG: hydrogenase expression protein [Anaerolineae bacterium]|nr:hydrogenase expression protein [Anaerolineae bacterium]
MHHAPLPIGKLPMEMLARLLRRYAHPDPRVVVGPEVGEDAAAIAMGDRYLVVKTDPITFATDEIGWYVVNVNANDIATRGAAPRWFLCTLLLPEGHTDSTLVETIFSQIAQACEELGVALCGGHTEITYNLDRPVAVGVMLGEVEAERLVSTRGVQAGDAIVLTKGIAVEGTAIIAREMDSDLRERFSAEFLARCRQFLREPGISVVRDARIAARAAHVHAMHDPTEGGLATALRELATAGQVGLRVQAEAIPILPETQALCDHLGLDPLGLIASGALLIAVAPEDAARTVAALEEGGIRASVIGEATSEPGECILLKPDGRERPLPEFPRDELARLFG